MFQYRSAIVEMLLRFLLSLLISYQQVVAFNNNVQPTNSSTELKRFTPSNESSSAPIIKETYHPGDADPNGITRPIVYFRPQPTTEMTPLAQSNITIMDFRKEKLDMNSGVTYENENNARTNEQERLLTLKFNNNNSGEQRTQPWSPITTRIVQNPSMNDMYQSFPLKNPKIKTRKPILMIADSGTEYETPKHMIEVGQLPTKYVVIGDDGSRIPVVLQGTTENESQEMSANTAIQPINVDDDTTGVAKDDRQYDTYSNQLASGLSDVNNPGTGSFVNYAIPPPPPPPPSFPGTMPIMANVYWRKIVYPSTMVPMSDQQGGSASIASTSAGTLANNVDPKNDANVKQAQQQRYIVYYVKKDNGSLSSSDSNVNQVQPLTSSSSDRQQQLAQTIIRQIEQLETDNGGQRNAIATQLPVRDQDILNSQHRLNVLNENRNKLIMVDQIQKQPIKIDERPMESQDEELIVIRRRPKKNRTKPKLMYKFPINPYSSRLVSIRPYRRIGLNRPLVRLIKL